MKTRRQDQHSGQTRARLESQEVVSNKDAHITTNTTAQTAHTVPADAPASTLLRIYKKADIARRRWS